MTENGLSLTGSHVERLIESNPTIWIGKLKLEAHQVDVKRHMARFDASNVENCSRVSVFVDGIEIAVMLYDFMHDVYYYPTVDLIVGDLNPILRLGVESLQDLIDRAPESVVERVLNAALQRGALRMTQRKGLRALETPLIGLVQYVKETGHIKARARVIQRKNPIGSTYNVDLEFSETELFYAGRVSVGAFERAYNDACRQHVQAIRIFHGLVPAHV